MPRFLHVGCGKKRKDQTLRPFKSLEWEEVTLDIDEGVMPDIVDKLPELAKVESSSFDAVFSSHNVEHLYPHDVLPAFKAFYRVLKDDGLLIVTCPDLQSLGEKLACGDIDTPLYESAAGPISPIDVLYGFRPAMAEGNLYMAHHTGYTAKSMETVCARAGFASIAVARRPSKYDLWTVATKTPKAQDDLRALAKIYISPV
ncbi:class I SAM-dependent methyltransferase [Microvirga makkahensis]|uniref:Methyltransferase domain-containing protein n=1 Tax=Microvirga makkahensis TaxID=1128670 RepID=A0A7X3SPM5_9HYPH|nr:methyltransferase domain-containing protein [Microvirga makkahensis]MXQ12425.1 methyltransferase domain-containing protein [Microvirga makkahensis]